ncbi:MAG: sensor domain-containing diguanylate cyclase, partial [Candidatus Electrothrix sp. AR3]|nr:sensor domain-containing diguanylate cyclase [Candidatus Electrothrix sp. AR3]
TPRTYLVDRDGEIIHHPEHGGSWSRYLDNKKNLHALFPEVSAQILANHQVHSDRIFSYHFGELFRNREEMRVVFKPKNQVLKNLKNNNLLSALIVAATVLLVSIPLSSLISIIPSKLQKQLAEAYNEIKAKSDIIDKHVMVSTTDKDGVIQEISTCFTKITGYTQDEAIGSYHNILRHPDTPKEIHQQLWNTILAGKVWSGELKDLHKNGNTFWIREIITPDFNEQGEIFSFTTVAHDITDKKIIEQMSVTDSLTGLANRRRIDEALTAEIARFNRYKTDFSVILFDIDHFKKINDTYGHQAGDDVLVRLTDFLKKQGRETDIIGRWGGEEFLLIASETGLEDAFQFAERLRKKIEHYPFPVIGQITISCGVTQYTAHETTSTLISRVDDALYKAKNIGRNSVIRG